MAPPADTTTEEPTVADLMKMILSQQELLKTMGSSRPPYTRPPLVKPRVGNIDITGVWTGNGASDLMEEPTSTYCMRTFDADTNKNHQQLAPVQDRCKQGLRDSPELLFCMPDEPNAGTIVRSIQALEDHLTLCGMEGVFTLIQATPSGLETLNMLQSPGRVTTEIVDAWCKAVMTDGIPRVEDDGSLGLHPICPHDRTNMLWSAAAVLNSCTETLRQDLKLLIPPTVRTGPKVVMTIYEKLYRPSLANNKTLLEKLEQMDIRKYAGENVRLFVQDATKIVRELQMNYMSATALPELTMTALTGLTKSSDPYLLHKVREIRLASDVNGFGFSRSTSRPDALSALQQVDAMYRLLVNTKDYAPLQSSSSLRAMIASEVDAKLTQDRTAGGSRGTHTRGKGCYNCGSPDHFQANCPKPQQPPAGGPPAESPPSSDSSSKVPGMRKSSHGLPEALHSQAKALAKAKLLTMPARENIPDTAEFSILLEGKTVGKYCRHCGRFVYGASQHTTKEHKGQSTFPYKGAAAPPAATAAIAEITHTPPAVSFSLVANLPQTQNPPSVDLTSVPQISTEAFLNRQTDYDFGNPRTIDAHLARALKDGDETSFLAVLGKAYGG